jgi:hypothetical protein
MNARRLTGGRAIVGVAVFWSAVGFPMALGVLITFFRPVGPSIIPLAAATIAMLGFAGSFVLIRRWSR